MRLRNGLKWLIAAGVVLLATAATAQNGSEVTRATGDVNYARQNTVVVAAAAPPIRPTAGPASTRSGRSRRSRSIETQETKLSGDEKKKLANALLSDMRSASNSLTSERLEGRGPRTTASSAKCLRDIQTKVNKAIDSAPSP